MLKWLKQIRCKHVQGAYIQEGTCYNACKKCDKPMGVKQ